MLLKSGFLERPCPVSTCGLSLRVSDMASHLLLTFQLVIRFLNLSSHPTCSHHCPPKYCTHSIFWSWKSVWVLFWSHSFMGIEVNAPHSGTELSQLVEYFPAFMKPWESIPSTQVFTYPGAWEGHGQVRGPEEQGSWFAVVERVSTPTNLKFHTGSIQETIPDSTTKKSQQVLPASDNYCAMLTWPCVTKPLPH